MDTQSSLLPSPPAADHNRYGVLAMVVIAAIVAVAATSFFTKEIIARNERAWYIARLHALVPDSIRDNDLYSDRISVRAPDLLGNAAPITIYRARLGGKPTAAILTAVAPDGYGGAIDLLVGVDYGGAVLGIDVLRHNETPGIGDGFAPHRSNWLATLVGKSIDRPLAARWTIRKDGGDFDQFTGASITPRAILKATRRTLEYYTTYRQRIFDARSVE